MSNAHRRMHRDNQRENGAQFVVPGSVPLIGQNAMPPIGFHNWIKGENWHPIQLTLSGGFTKQGQEAVVVHEFGGVTKRLELVSRLLPTLISRTGDYEDADIAAVARAFKLANIVLGVEDEQLQLDAEQRQQANEPEPPTQEPDRAA